MVIKYGSGKEIELSPDEAREIYSELNQLLGGVVKTVVERHYLKPHHDPWQIPFPIPFTTGPTC